MIKYIVTENAVKGYVATVDGYNVTNTHTPNNIKDMNKPNTGDDSMLFTCGLALFIATGMVMIIVKRRKYSR